MDISILWPLQKNLGTQRKSLKKQYVNLTDVDLDAKIAAHKLENSYIGILGKSIEPAIKPLGYDWKIGIALITSFAAREVFVGTLATIYSVGSEEEASIKSKMQKERHTLSGTPVYNLASGISLLLFYAFAMQCMSTLAIVKRETNTWKWPMVQFGIYDINCVYFCFSSFSILKIMHWIQNILVIVVALFALYFLYNKFFKKKKVSPGCDDDHCGC